MAKSVGKIFERFMRMDDATWARHANPLSGWSRLSILPLLALAIWSREWLDWWALVSVALVLLWNWINPRLFKVPLSTNSWMSQGVMGERYWIASKEVPIPKHHTQVTRVLIVFIGIGVALLALGLWQLDLYLTLVGLVISMGGKLWFLDRMVWLFHDMTPTEGNEDR
ncbi:hypothetical protein A9Q83_05755 [Alphaproteobacteria bacterium 46_93_T64]|nr:hypothetical protein A9Q83_05755 [Alphaproteobacteria bacterium 46_93_T64]